MSDFTITNPVYGCIKFNNDCIMEVSVDMEQQSVTVKITDQMQEKEYIGTADLSEVE